MKNLSSDWTVKAVETIKSGICREICRRLKLSPKQSDNAQG